MSTDQENTSTSETSMDKTCPDTVSKDLPSDIIFEILTRTSLETLDTCKSVCNEWNHLTRESTFMPLYCIRTNTAFGYFVQDMIHNKFFSMFVSLGQNSSSNGRIRNIPSDMRILASCDQGILCCQRSSGKNSRYYVGKPATEQWQPLPNPKLRFQTAAIAMMVVSARPLRYRIVRLSRQGSTRNEKVYRCEIFDSETWKWKTLQYINIPYCEIIDRNPPLSTSNSIHWLTSEDNVLQFHKIKQSFQKFPLPKSMQKNYSYYKQLVEYEGRLGLTYLTEERNMELWVMQRDQSNSMKWMKKMVVDIESLESRVKYPSPFGFYNDGIVFMKAVDEVIFYMLQDCSFSRVKLDRKLKIADEVFQYRSDFETVDLGRST